VAFLTRTAVLDRLSGPLCDAVLGTAGSAAVLGSLERSDLLVVALDRQRAGYRYHKLVGELLGGELERSEPELVGELTRRAAHCCGDHELPEAAVDYAMGAGAAAVGDLAPAGRGRRRPGRGGRGGPGHRRDLAATVAPVGRAILAIGRQDWQDAETLVEQAQSLVNKAHLEDCATSLVLYAAGARVAIHHGNRDQADQDLARAQQLQPLATHLSFREMGQRLYLSPHTVKTQALSIYRKLGVSSRGQAVQRMQEISPLAR
jgi:ATP/maltotriose-dependent transcriptional regulator MalT